jgi:hypothetical protein
MFFEWTTMYNEGEQMFYFDVLRNLPGGTEQNYETP